MLKILVVCAGNICRSPMAVALLEKQLQGLPVLISSAGTTAQVGSDATDATKDVLRRQTGLEIVGHKASQISENEIKSADLVLTMTRDQRQHLANLVPSAMRRIFTLREFARLCDALEPFELKHLDEQPELHKSDYGIFLVYRNRGSVRAPSKSDADDVIDPYLLSNSVYQKSFKQINAAVESTAAYLKRVLS